MYAYIYITVSRISIIVLIKSNRINHEESGCRHYGRLCNGKHRNGTVSVSPVHSVFTRNRLAEYSNFLRLL